MALIGGGDVLISGRTHPPHSRRQALRYSALRPAEGRHDG